MPEIYSLNPDGELTTVDLLATNRKQRDELRRVTALITAAEHERDEAYAQASKRATAYKGLRAHHQIDMVLAWALGLVNGVILAYAVYMARGLLRL